MAAAEATLTEVLTDDVYEHLEATNRRLLDSCQAIIDSCGLPAYTEGLGAKGCVIFSAERMYEYRDYLTKVDDELSTLAWLYHMNHGVFMTPGVEEEWTLSIAHADEDLQPYVDAFEAFARDVTSGGRRPRAVLGGQGLGDVDRVAEVEALGHVDAVFAQHFRGHVVLDVLGDRLLAQPAGDLDDRLDGQLVGVAAGHVADERAVDLDQVEREPLQMVEGPELAP